MSDHVYKKIELVGSSPESIEAAVANALARAQKTVRNMRWLEITETRGHIETAKLIIGRSRLKSALPWKISLMPFRSSGAKAAAFKTGQAATPGQLHSRSH